MHGGDNDNGDGAVRDHVFGRYAEDGLCLLAAMTVANDDDVGSTLDNLFENGIANLWIDGHSCHVGDLETATDVPEVGGYLTSTGDALFHVSIGAVNVEDTGLADSHYVEEFDAVAWDVLFGDEPIEGLLAVFAIVNGEEDQAAFANRHLHRVCEVKGSKGLKQSPKV